MSELAPAAGRHSSSGDGARGKAGLDELDALREQNRQLQEALTTRIDIEQAKGVLAERLGLSADDAFALLRYAARTARMSIHALARETRPGVSTPGAVVIAAARTQRWRAAAQRERAEAQRAGGAGRQQRAQELLERSSSKRPSESQKPADG